MRKLSALRDRAKHHVCGRDVALRADLCLWLLLVIISIHAVSVSNAQTTRGLISGRVLDGQSRLPIAGAAVCYEHEASNTAGIVYSGRTGFYAIPSLPPGDYNIRVVTNSSDAAEGTCLKSLQSTGPNQNVGQYQPLQLHGLNLAVAGRIDLSAELRHLSRVWERGLENRYVFPKSEAVLTYYGPDVDTSRYGSFDPNAGNQGALEATLSNVIDPEQVRRLPFAGRDIYAMLITQPGVAADTGTGRGLGLSIFGVRPSSSNFMLDGLENNVPLTSGPLSAVAPMAVQEYRISTSNFSAEYGRTSGFLANAVTRSGGTAWHGVGYFNLRNDALNANDFQRNRAGRPRSALKEVQPGFQVGGPIANSVFVSSALEHLRNRTSLEERDFQFPSTQEIASAGPITQGLLQQYAPSSSSLDGSATLRPPKSIDRYLLLERIDYRSPSGKQQLMGRLAFSSQTQPDFIWTPYPDFVSELTQPTFSLALNHTLTIAPNAVNELRGGWSSGELSWDRPHPEIPTLRVRNSQLTLPGSPAFSEFENEVETFELNDNFLWARDRHIVKFGGGLLSRSVDGALTFGRDGLVEFPNARTFLRDGVAPRGGQPTTLRAPLSVSDGGELDFQIPNYEREYRYQQYYFFAQDTFRATSRLVFNAGIRYERFRAPRNTGSVKDALLTFGDGSDVRERVANAGLQIGQAGDQQIYAEDANDWAARVGFSWAADKQSRTLLRGSYGIFYDRPFDNLWQNVANNRLVLPASGFDLNLTAGESYLAPVADVLPTLASDAQGRQLQGFPKLTAFDSNLRTAYTQNFFFGAQHRLRDDWFFETNYVGSLGRKLLTTDVVNRDLSGGDGANGRLNPNFNTDFSYRANQGFSSYHAFTFLSRYTPRNGFLQLAYTWSHGIDNQSDPLNGDFFDLVFTNPLFDGPSTASRIDSAAFSEQFNSSADRGNFGFDQRHNLVLYSLWGLPTAFGETSVAGVFRDWKISQVAAFRTGFPYSVRGTAGRILGNGVIFNGRADLLDPSAAETDRAAPDRGGKILLNREAFANVAADQFRVGTSGRNAFRGPGLYNVDFSLSRSFQVGWLREDSRLTFRADVFNILNHANLNNPIATLADPDFGLAVYGRRASDSGVRSLAPLNETPRQIQLILRFEF